MAGRSLPHAMMMMIPEPWQNHETMSAGAAGVLRVPLLPDGAVGRPGVDRVHRRHGDRRGARPQRPAPVALLRHQGRPGRHGVRGRRARHPARERRSSRSACSPGRMFLVDTEQGRIVDDEELKQRARRRSSPYGEWLRRAPRSTLDDLPDAPALPRARSRRPCCSRQQAFGYTHEDLRILLAPMATQRRGSRRLDGHRHAAGGPLGPAAAALQLLQAALRPGHQPAARRDPRRARHVDGLDDRPRGQPARADARVVPADQAQVPRSSTTRSWRSSATSTCRGFTVDHAADALRPRPRAAPGLERAMDELCRAGQRRRRRRATTS